MCVHMNLSNIMRCSMEVRIVDEQDMGINSRTCTLKDWNQQPVR